MKQFYNRLYGKIAAVFLLLLLLLGTVQMYIAARSCINIMDETRQKLNAPMARNIAVNFTPFLQDGLAISAIEPAVQGMLMINPDIEIYFLDAQGKILASFLPGPGEVRLTSVNLEPIRRFLADPEAIHCTGDDPCRPGNQKLFSAAPVRYGPEGEGYIYVVQGANEYHSTLSMVLSSHIGRSMLQVLLVALLFTGIVGLLLFGLVTRRFNAMTEVVKGFEKGDFQRRIPVKSNDEIGQLARAFNQMADTIVSNIEEIQAKDRMRRDLIANISHDLRSPLAAIQGYLETLLMREGQLPAEKKRALLETIFKNARQLSKLVGELFELSRLDAKQVEPKMEAFCVAELAQDVVLKFQNRAEKQAVMLKVLLAENLPRVRGDIAMIDRALSNLIDNALNFTPCGGVVTVELYHENGKVYVKVADTGRGISAEDIPHIFERFYRGDKSRTRQTSAQGAGLGLAITRKIVEAHHSEITVKSVVGKGTSFTFYLPTNA